MKNYPSENTSLLIVDPFNYFLSEDGKLGSSTRETVKGVNLIENLKNILSAARSSGVKIVYVPHRQTEKGDYSDWKFLAPSQGIFKIFHV
jgi:nicotinamidase-related amidase